jgi:hypothetical protein
MKFRIDVTVEVSLPCDEKSAVAEAAKIREAVEFEVLGFFYGRETVTRTLVRVTPDGK